MNKHVIDIQASLYQALNQMNKHRVKFLIAADSEMRIVGTLTDGDMRRAILRGVELNELIDTAVCKEFTFVLQTAGLAEVLCAFHQPKVDFLPVLDEQGTLCNLITRRGLSAFLMRNQKFQMDADFETAEGNELEHEIFARPWGFYKTTVLNELFQSKVIYVMPGQALSLQSHMRREEYWNIIHGTGVIQLGESVHSAMPGGAFFIPKGCKHRLTNTSQTDTLIIAEVQLGDYFGEDDIFRHEDIYGRG